VVRWFLGDSLFAIRILAALASSSVVLITGLMVRQLGGKRFAQILGALAVIAAPVLLGTGRFFSMNAFDLLFWALAFYILIRIFKTDNPKLWLWFGLAAGLGLMNKYSMGFLGMGLIAGLLLTSHRKYFLNKWLWIGGLLALLLFLPHLVWEYLHDFPSLEFMRNASQLKNLPTSPIQFLLGQFLSGNFVNAPIWLLGLFYFFFHKEGKKYRVFGWITVLIFVILVMNHSKLYYFSPLFPILLAGGAVLMEKIIDRIDWQWLKGVYPGMLVISALIMIPFSLPVLPVKVFIKYEELLGVKPHQEERSSLGVLPQHYADQFGWEEFVELFAKAYQNLSPEEQAGCMIFVRNYGEAGAIDFFGEKYNLPKATCGHNNYWLWGPPDWDGKVALILGSNLDPLENLEDEKAHFNEVKLVGVTRCQYCMPYENNRAILLCRGFKYSLKNLWPQEKRYL